MIIPAPGGGVGRDFRCKAAPPPGSDVRLLLPPAFSSLGCFALPLGVFGEPRLASICEKSAYTHRKFVSLAL